MEGLYTGEYREKDIPDVLNLFSLAFSKEMSEKWFLWKYKNSPWSSKGYIAVYGEKIVAFYGGIKLPFGFHDKKLWAYQFCDVMTHPEYRGRLFSKNPLIVILGEMFYRENPMDFAYGFPSPRHARLQSIRLGGEGYRHVRLYKKRHLKRRIMSWRLKVKEGWELSRDEGVDSFLVRHDYASLQFLKNKEYLKWRYMENPWKSYRLLVFKKMGITKGYVVFTLEDNCLNIMEIFFKDKKDIKDILVSLEDYVLKNMDNISGIKAWFHPNEPLIKYLEILGYSSEDDIPVAFKPVNKESGVMPEIFYKSYFYRMGDYDAF